MKGMLSSLKWLLIIFISAIISFIIGLLVTKCFHIKGRINNIIVIISFLIIYVIFMKIWIKYDKNWLR